jgi:hypothetical protein
MTMRIKGTYATNKIEVDGKPLDPTPSQKVWNHSPDGFSWGYGGSGPAQLALALLLHAGVKERMAVELHHDLKREFVAPLPEGDFEADLVIHPDGSWIVKTH